MTTTRTRLGAALGGAALAAATLVALPSPGQADTTIVLTTENHNAHGWAGSTTGDATTQMTAGPGTPPAGSGSLELRTDSTDDSVTVGTDRYGDLAPAALAELAYGAFRYTDSDTAASTHLAANLTIATRNQVGLEQFVTTLVWEPTYAARPVRENRWESYSAIGSVRGWWSTRNRTACAPAYGTTPGDGNSSCTYAEAIGTLPAGAYIAAISFKAGSGWSNVFHAALDRMVIATTDGTTVDRTVFDWEAVIAPPPPTGQLDTRMTVDDVAFDEFKSGTYSGRIEADIDTRPAVQNWKPLAGAYVEVFLDADEDPDNGHEEIECAATSDANGVFSCSPEQSLIPNVFELDSEFVAVFAGGPGHKPAFATGRATMPGPIREPVQLGEDAQASATACARWHSSQDVLDPDTGEVVDTLETDYWICADRFDLDGDGTDDQASASVTRLGDDGFEQWRADLPLSAVAIDVAAGTASINGTLDGASDSSTGETCAVAVTFNATGPAESESGADNPLDVEPGDGSAKVSVERDFSTTERPAAATGSACAYAAVAAGSSVEGSLTEYEERIGTVIVNG